MSRRSRPLQAALALLLSAGVLSGCALGTVAAAGAQGALEDQVSDAASAPVREAKAAAARLALTQVAQAAQLYAGLNAGSTAGFATNLQATMPAVAGQLSQLTDTRASIDLEDRCVSVTLPTGTPTEGC